MTRKPGSMYREIRGQAYARKEYMGGVPGIRISQFDIGDPRTKFPVKIHLDDRGPRRRRERSPAERWREVADALAARDRTGEEESIDSRAASIRSLNLRDLDKEQLFLTAGFWRSDDGRDRPPTGRHPRPQRKDGRLAISRRLADGSRGPRAGTRDEGRRHVPSVRGPLVRRM